MSDGNTFTFSTPGSNVDQRLQTIIGLLPGRRSYSVTILNLSTNSGNISVGRNGNTGLTLIPGDSYTFDRAVASNIAINDLGTKGTIVCIDDSGPLEAIDEPSVVVAAR